MTAYDAGTPHHARTLRPANGGVRHDRSIDAGQERATGGAPVTVRLLTNIGRLWTGSEIWSNAAILTHNDRIAWVGRASELPASLPGVVEDIVDVDSVENLGGALVTPGLIDAHTHPVYAGNR